MLAFCCAALSDMSKRNGVEVGADGSVAIIFFMLAIKSAGSSIVEQVIKSTIKLDNFVLIQD